MPSGPVPAPESLPSPRGAHLEMVGAVLAGDGLERIAEIASQHAGAPVAVVVPRLAATVEGWEPYERYVAARIAGGRPELFPLRLRLSGSERLALIRAGARLRLAVRTYERNARPLPGESYLETQRRVLGYVPGPGPLRKPLHEPARASQRARVVAQSR